MQVGCWGIYSSSGQEERSVGEPVAIKVMQLVQGSAEWEVLQREVAITRRLHAHPHIVRLLDTLPYSAADRRTGRPNWGQWS